ncbi:MAG: choice-of-anchor D domain-containing protein [Thermomicrobiales bacterium]
MVAPFAVVTPSAINFGSQQQGTQSGAQAVTITNTGTANLVFGPGTPIGLASITNFNILTNGCPGAAGTLAPGASCTVVVRFAPTTTGNLSTTLSFADNSSGGSPQLVVLNGVGTAAPVTAPQINFTPASVNFGNQQQGVTSGAQTIVVENVGNDNLFISAIIPVAINGGNAADFAILSNNCPSGIIIPLQPGAQCTVSVTFTPTALGQRSSALRFVDNDNNVIGASQYVPLEGVGVPAGVAIAPASIDFGSVLQGTNSGAQAATITNTGSASITLTGPINTANNIVGGNTSDFVVVNSACPVSPATLAPGVSCTVTLRFTPGGAVTGNRASTFQVVTSAGTVQTVLNGFASPTPVTNPFATLSAATLSFGDQVVNTPSASQSVTITNTGNGNLTFTAPPSFGGPDAAMFSPLVSDGCGTQTLIPNASCTVVVRFTPTSVGQKSATLVFTSNISGTYSIVNLTGNGVSAGNAVASVDPAVVNFGDTALNTSAAQTVTVTNTGTGALGITGFTPSSAPFTISGNSCTVGTVLQPNASCSFAVTFAPTATGAASSSVVIASNVPGGSTTINVSGFGVSSVIAFTPPPVNFGSVAIGSGSTLGLLVTNTGSGPLTITGVGGLAAPFSIEGDTCSGQTLAPGASCVLDIKFQPTAPGYVFDSVGVVTTTGTFSSVVDGTGTLTPVAAVTLNPGAINFGEVPTGTSVARTVTVSNTGDAPLGITSVGIAGSGYAISGNGCIGQILNPGQSCTFAVTFSPATGANTGTVTVTTSVGAPTIALTGIGVSSVLSFTPAPLNFGQLSVGTSSTLGVLITNTGGGPVSISSVGGLAGPYSITGTTCTNVTLGAGESCAVTVQFSPGAAGYFADALEVSNTIPAVIASSAVVGSAVAAPTPALTISPAVLNFGSVSVGANASQTVTLSNTGSAPFNITGISGAGGAFSVSGNGCTGTTLNPGDSCTFAVTFAPTAAGATSVTLSISDTAPGNPHSLSATGTGVSNVLSFTPSPLNFGQIAVGSGSTLGVLITNTGNGPVAIASVTGLGGGGPFSYVGNSCAGITLAPGDSCAVNVQFAPTTIGLFSDAIRVNGPGAVLLATSGVQGSSVTAATPAISFSPAVLNFGTVSVGATVSQTVTVTNTGGVAFGITSLSALAAPFSLSGNGCTGTVLNPGQSCTFTVTYAPTAAGASSASLTVTSSAPGSPHTIGISGTGVSSVLNFNPNPLDFGDVAIGTSATRGVLVTNTGGGPVAITAVGGPSGDFAVDSTTCVTTLAPGASCVVVVRYTSTGPAGVDTDQIDLTVTGVGTVSSSVRGNSVATPTPAVSFSPAVVNFGNVPLATSVAATVTMTNTGNAPLVISSFTPAGAAFTVSGNGCTASVTLNPGQSCSFAVTYVPAGVGPASGSASIASNVPGSPHVVNFSGFGVSSVIAFTPPPVNFGQVAVGSGSTLGLLVTNTGGGPITISSATVPAGPFSIVGNTCGTLTLAPNASCVLDVKFQPVGVGYVFETLTLATSAGNFTTVLDGTGINAPLAAITIDPGAIAFGNVPVGNTVSQLVTVSNTGTAPLNLGVVAIAGSGFGLSGNGCNNQILNPGQNCTFTVTFTPALGLNTGSVTVPSSVGSPTIALSGNGVSSVLSFAPNPLDFGNVTVGTSSTLGVLVTNTGGAPVAITAVGGPSGDFALVSTTCVATLAPGDSCSVVVRYTPSAPGADVDSIDLTVTGVGTVSSGIVGNGVVAPVPTVTIQPTSLDFGDVQIGTTSPALPLTVTNTGSAPLNISTLGTGNAAFVLSANGCAGATLQPGESCVVGVTFTPAAVGQTTSVLQINDNAGGVATSQFVSLTGNGISAGLAVTPGSLDFGNQQVNTSSAVQTVTVTNVGLGTITISAVTPAGTFSTFADTCTGQTLGSGDSCTVGVRFNPNAVGQATGTLTFTTTGPDPIVSLVGVGISAQLSVTPGSLDFGPHQLGTSTPAQTVTVKNIGTGSVTITATALAGSDPTNFEITGNSCQPSGNDVTLAAGQECTISVRFTPVGLVAGNRSALLNITSNAPAAASVMSVGLAGIATTGAVYVTPASLDFGDQQLGTTSVARTVTVTNAGTGPVTFVAPAITGNFAIFANTCTLAALAPGDSCTIGVVFQPVTPGGPKTGTLTITDTASPLAQTVSLTGNAISAQLSVTPSTLDFGNQTVNTQSVSQTVTVKNVGSGPVTITSTTPVLGNNPADFLVVADTCQPGGNDVTLAAGETCTISVLFQPSATGARNAQLTITSNAPATGSTVAVSLLGFGVTSGPAISFNPSSLDFGSIPVNTSATRTITVTNSGTAPLIFNASAVTLTGSAAYSLTGNTCNGVTLLPGESCTVGVTFAPTTQGPTAATTLAFASNAPGSPHSVNVTGIGTSAVFSFNPLALNFGNVQVGSTSTLSVLVTNNTGGPARITGISGIGAPFTLVGDSCTNVLLPDGESCALTVTFAPAAVGYFSNTATLNLSTGGSISLALTGTGTPIPTPLISITPASLDFGYVQNGQVAPAQTVTIKNIGSIDVAISSAAITLGGANFVESADTCSGQILQPGQTCTYSVTFAPGATTGPIVGAVTITSNAPSSTHIVPLFGNGITAGLSIAPASLNFGNVQVGTASVAQVVTVTNTGSGPVTISNYGIIGTDAAQYEVVDSTCMSLGNPSTLPPGGFCTFAVRFKPLSPGAKIAAQLSITDSAAGTPQLVGLNGVGVTPAFNLSANGLDFGNVVVGQTSATQTVTLTNSTNGPLAIAGVFSTNRPSLQHQRRYLRWPAIRSRRARPARSASTSKRRWRSGRASGRDHQLLATARVASPSST